MSELSNKFSIYNISIYISDVWCGRRARVGATPPRSRAPWRLRPRAAALLLPCDSHREGQEKHSGRRDCALGLPLLLRLELLAQDRGDLTLHECPRHRRVRQRALLSARTVNLKITHHYLPSVCFLNSIRSKKRKFLLSINSMKLT